MGLMGIISIVLTWIGFGSGITLGILAGYFMLIYFEPDTVKDPVVNGLHKLDMKAIQDLLPEIPLWVKSPDYEKVDWLNTFVHEIWPYMNKALCQIIRESAQPYIDEYKPKYKLESVDFESLTLGTLPPVFFGVKIHETQEKELIFELAAKFAGNPDIKVAVKAYGVKAVAQLVDAQVFASARITLKPLVPEFPCFSQVTVSLLEKPYVDFGLKLWNTDLMAIPILDKYVQGMIKNIVANMYLWPHKLDVPVMEPQADGPKKSQGMLVVNVLRAKQLRNKDIVGLSDPYVRLTLAGSIQKTKTIMNNLNPEWNETFSMIVNDPEIDSLDISVWDWDQVGAHDKLGVQVIPLKQLTPDEVESFTLDLKKNFDPNDKANQRTRGQITLELHYKPFDGNEEEVDTDGEYVESDSNRNLSLNLPKAATVSFDPSPTTITPHKLPSITPSTGGGLLLITVHSAEDLEGKNHTNAYVRIIFRGEKRRTKVIKKNRDPRWEQEFEFVLDDTPMQDRLLVEIKSKATGIIHYRESLGHVEIDLADVVKCRRMNETYQLLGSKNGKVHVELQWRSTAALSMKRHSTTPRSGPLTMSGPLNSPKTPQGKAAASPR